ncbi:hypothetical protein [Lactiplantibacillus pentosus]|uniref:hypothetical protein n=1 Tax=Lactiplantibacillus pentosus TaxID=1589 RepID=UPI0013C3F24B|nr:hypothetical protein [Lactiplantibacillus pentosus]
MRLKVACSAPLKTVRAGLKLAVIVAPNPVCRRRNRTMAGTLRRTVSQGHVLTSLTLSCIRKPILSDVVFSY